MFKKKKCPKCKEKISEKYSFCPYCRSSILKEEDWGLLGKSDFMEPEEIKLPMGFNVLFNSLIKTLNKQIKEFETEQTRQPEKTNVKKGGISISISTSGNKSPEIKIRSFGNIPEFKEQEEKMRSDKKAYSLKDTSKLNTKRFSGKPKEEPKTNIRKFSDKVVYEIDLPGVKSIKDISIIQLENSIEIKALAKDKVFYKIIPINLPIKNYSLLKGRLVLELDDKE